MSYLFGVRNRLSVKLVFSLVSVVLITGAFCIFIGIRTINETIITQAYDSVQSSLLTAQFIYDERINISRIYVEHIASLPYVTSALARGDYDLLIRKLHEVREESDLDIMNIADPQGRIAVRSRNPVISGDSVADDRFVGYVIRHRKPVYGTDVMSGEHLLREGRDLADQALIRRIPTPRARKRSEGTENRGLVLKAAYPVFHQGRFIGVIYGATLINRNYEIVDRIKSLVFKDEQYDGYDYGTATIFLDDVRISTNVKSQKGSRAIGTCVSEEVYNAVVEHGKIWLDKAFVVKNWYISSYKPIYDIEKKVIGILYVGILEAKFNQIKQQTILSFLLVILVTLLIAVLIAVYLIQNILQPVRTLYAASREIAKGNYEKKIAITSSDELGELCATFNRMGDAIVERDNRLKEQTQKQTMQLEKLASLGRLASGIAHEINNPLTGVLTFSSELKDDLGDTEYGEDIDVIINETLRCRKIVKEVLDFARETKLEKQNAGLNQVIESTLTILENHVAFQDTKIIRQLAPDIPTVSIDVNQMKSVISNLVVNAADAMPSGGTITIATGFDARQSAVRMSVSDTGEGIPQENLGKLFDPFFTTKQTGKGTGLGLSITYGIIQRHRGTIQVESESGRGTTFTITIPADTVA